MNTVLVNDSLVESYFRCRRATFKLLCANKVHPKAVIDRHSTRLKMDSADGRCIYFWISSFRYLYSKQSQTASTMQAAATHTVQYPDLKLEA